MAISDGHPVMIAAQRLFVANVDSARSARDVATAAEAALATVRALPPDCPADDYAGALRAADIAVRLAIAKSKTRSRACAGWRPRCAN